MVEQVCVADQLAGGWDGQGGVLGFGLADLGNDLGEAGAQLLAEFTAGVGVEVVVSVAVELVEDLGLADGFCIDVA